MICVCPNNTICRVVINTLPFISRIHFFFISYQMYWLTEYPVGKVSFFKVKYNTRFSRFSNTPPPLPSCCQMSSCVPVFFMQSSIDAINGVYDNLQIKFYIWPLTFTFLFLIWPLYFHFHYMASSQFINKILVCLQGVPINVKSSDEFDIVFLNNSLIWCCETFWESCNPQDFGLLCLQFVC